MVTRNDIYKYLNRGDGVCIYFNCATKLCSIYKERPIICRVDDAYEQYFRNEFTLQEYYEENYKACEKFKKMDGVKMSNIKAALQAKFEGIFGFAPGDDYAPRVRNALEIICQGKYREADLLDITDTSIMSNGKSGLVLTLDSVCVKDSGNSTSKFIARYEDIDYMHMNEDSFLGVDITALELNMKYGTTYRISIDKINKDKLMEFINYAISLYENDEKLEW
ncbi:hypothetical protein SOV_52320 [Sporomusa ovata DSM 2662]|nr:YkgJ family cysteine cluster protein [Sporomusa ovata]EQB27604.1 hypothetical protein SOV_2c05010 [Sporomusa ovata DSM 2662]